MGDVPSEDVKELKHLMEKEGAAVHFKENGYKKNWQKCVALLARFLFFLVRTFSASEKRFEDFTTTLGDDIYLGNNFDSFSLHRLRDYVTVCHEMAHVQDNSFWFKLSYLFFPFPIFWTKRSFWEYRGYAMGMIAYYRVKGRIPHYYVPRVSKYFVNGSYLWMEPPWREEHVKWNLQNIAAYIFSNNYEGYDPDDLPWDDLLEY